MEENSISIVNRTNGQLTGENAQALPIKFVGGISWIQYILIGVAITVIFGIYFIATIQKNVVAVEVSGKADNFQIFEIK